jgi:hypothetical protein
VLWDGADVFEVEWIGELALANGAAIPENRGVTGAEINQRRCEDGTRSSPTTGRILTDDAVERSNEPL